MKPSDRGSAPEILKIEVTDAMCAAGIEVLDQYEDAPITSARLVSKVFSAMARAHDATKLEIVEPDSCRDI